MKFAELRRLSTLAALPVRTYLAFAAAIFAAGCSATSVPQPSSPTEELSGADRAMLNARASEELAYSRLSGFLSDYSRLTPSHSINGALTYRNPTKKLGFYKMAILEPISVQLRHPEYADPTQLKEVGLLAGFLENEIEHDFGDSIVITHTPGYGVMRIRIALTDTQPNSPVLGRYRTWDENHPGFGAAAIEMEILDSQTGEQLASMIDWRDGSMKNLTGLFSQRDEAEQSLEEWSELLRNAIDDSRGLHRGFGMQETPDLFD